MNQIKQKTMQNPWYHTNVSINQQIDWEQMFKKKTLPVSRGN